MQGVNIADFRMARVFAEFTFRVSDCGHNPGCCFFSRVGNIDGRAFLGFAHFTFAGQRRNGWEISQFADWFRESLSELGIEPPDNFSGQFDMRQLVFADRDNLGLI